MNLRDFLQADNLPSIEFSGLSEMSTDIEVGDLFVAVGSSSKVRDHILEAERSGAVAAIVDQSLQIDLEGLNLPVLKLEELAISRAALASKFFFEPSADIECIGITGTNGKTSVAYWIADLSSRLGKKSGYCGTLGWGNLDDLKPTRLTTPNAIDIQRRLAWFVKRGFKSVALEVSSHALDQGRTSAIDFDTGVFTNLSRDHLDYHSTMEAYAKSKAKLFEEYDLKNAVVCVDGSMGRDLVKAFNHEILTYGAKGDISWSLQLSPEGRKVTWNTPWGQFESVLPIFCEFSVANLAAAIGVLLISGISAEEIFLIIEELRQVPGRMETVNPKSTSGPKVIVDFAHTPAALKTVLESLRVRDKGRVISVVGCGGDRDKGKRSQMGEIVSELSDLAWFTSDNPRSEDPVLIVDEMMSGVRSDNIFVCIDREEAIVEAISEAAKEDVVLLFGKGDESTQESKGVFLPFNDKEIAKKILRS